MTGMRGAVRTRLLNGRRLDVSTDVAMNCFASFCSTFLVVACMASCTATQAGARASRSEGKADAERSAAAVARGSEHRSVAVKAVTYPAALRGTWRLDPLFRPCFLPLSPDSDGRFIVKADAIESYESTYAPISVEADPAKKNSWRIVSVENHLGTQKEMMKHSFTVEGDRLVEQDGDYQAVYVKCKERTE